jgi:hypothetical protein
MLVQPTGEGHDEKGKWIQSSAHGAGNYRPERRLHTPIISIRLSSCTVREDKIDNLTARINQLASEIYGSAGVDPKQYELNVEQGLFAVRNGNQG